MNFLKNTKKKLQTAVLGKRTKDDDDDDFDNYIPEVPPHPSLDPNSQTNNNNFAASFVPDFNAAFSQLSSATDSIANTLGSVVLPSFDTKEDEQDGEKKELSLEELKAKEEENKRIEKEKLRQQEESKKDREDWKFFLSLTAKVDDITSKTQSSLTKLKDESAVHEISKANDDPCYADQYDDFVPKSAGGWVAFDEEQQYNPADPIFHLPKVEGKMNQVLFGKQFVYTCVLFTEKKPEEPEPIKPAVIDESTIKLAKELIDDFGFTNPAPAIGTLAPDQIAFEPVDSSVDPFDTSFISVEAIRSGKAQEIVDKKKEEILAKLDQDVEFDPFDTTHIETIIQKDLTLSDDPQPNN